MPEKRQMNLYLEEDLIKRIKHAAIEEEQRLSEFVAIALERYLAVVEEKQKED
jgi:hypothetical protein